MIEGAVFDLDGTLLDSMEIWETVGEDYVRSLGCEPREGLGEKLRNLSMYQAACFCRDEYHLSLAAEEIMDGVCRMVDDFYFYRVRAKEGVGAFLKELSGKGVKMCVATATERRQAEAALKRCGLARYFSFLFTCTEVGHGKDEPAIYREAARRLGTEKARTAVFEDAWHALQTAKEDGFFTVGVYDSFEREQEKIRRSADVYLSGFADKNIIRKLEEASAEHEKERRQGE